jgi:hypothetical protein
VNGDNSSCTDDCGVVNGDNSSCTDDCGVVNGDNSSCTDDCGVVNGDNSSCAGCGGVANSGLVNDAIGVCGGTCEEDLNENGICDTDEEVTIVEGCTDGDAYNYDASANVDDASWRTPKRILKT